MRLPPLLICYWCERTSSSFLDKKVAFLIFFQIDTVLNKLVNHWQCLGKFRFLFQRFGVVLLVADSKRKKLILFKLQKNFLPWQWKKVSIFLEKMVVGLSSWFFYEKIAFPNVIPKSLIRCWTHVEDTASVFLNEMVIFIRGNMLDVTHFVCRQSRL